MCYVVAIDGRVVVNTHVDAERECGRVGIDVMNSVGTQTPALVITHISTYVRINNSIINNENNNSDK